MDKNFIDIVNSFCPHGELLRAEVLPGGYSSDVYILHVKVDDKEAVSYTHLTLPTKA